MYELGRHDSLIILYTSRPISVEGCQRIAERLGTGSYHIQVVAGVWPGCSAFVEKPVVVFVDAAHDGSLAKTTIEDLTQCGWPSLVIGARQSGSMREFLALGASGFAEIDLLGILGVVEREAGGSVAIPGRPGEYLSARQVEILELTAQGKSNKQIGQELHIEESTVKTHKGRIFRQLGVRSGELAVLVSLRLGIIA